MGKKEAKKKGFLLSCRSGSETMYTDSEEDSDYGFAKAKIVAEEKYEYDFVVIGGGSGGLAAAKAAFDCGAKVCVFDFVKPSTQGTTWGLGGTCVNVGCIPKKLMHQAGLLGEAVNDSKDFGWKLPDLSSMANSWPDLVSAVQDHIKSVNWTSKAELREKGIEYINGYAYFKDPHTVVATKKNGDEVTVTGKYILVACGGRPSIPDTPGALEYGVTSDDLFSLPHAPGKTLVVGAGYVSLECAGFLHALGYDVTIAVRSVIMRGFDKQMIEHVVKDMNTRGIKFLMKSEPISLKKQVDGRILVHWMDKDKAVQKDYFDTVLFATGRKASTKGLKLENAGVKVLKNGKILTEDEQTNVPHIYAVGDVLDGTPELTPVAINAGKLLAKRIFGGDIESMDYTHVATTLFTPLEYGVVGLTEEQADEKYGADNIEVYHTYYIPTESQVFPTEKKKNRTDNCYLKVIADRERSQKIHGFHFVGPNAGEVIQGYSVSLKCGVTWPILRSTVGIHPTVSQQIVRVFITKRSGIDPHPPACCS